MAQEFLSFFRPYHDFWWFVHCIARYNYEYDAYNALVMNFSGADPTYHGGGLAAYMIAYAQGVMTGSLSPRIVTMRISALNADPGYQEGLAVQIWSEEGPVINGSLVGPLSMVNGYYNFSVRIPVDSSLDEFEAAAFLLFDDTIDQLVFALEVVYTTWLYWQQSLILFENNVVEMQRLPYPGSPTPPIAVGDGGPWTPWSDSTPNPYILTGSCDRSECQRRYSLSRPVHRRFFE
jgi:hypothetical protein